MSIPFVVLMGIGTVFFGLICLIFLSSLMSWICRKTAKAQPAAVKAPEAAAAAPIPDRQAMIAAIAAAIAEDLGTDVSGIRILSVKKI